MRSPGIGWNLIDEGRPPRYISPCGEMEDCVDEVIAIAKALGDETRLRAVLALRGGEMCLCQLVELLGLANSTVSKHMSVLKQAGLVENRKCERWVYYRLPGEGASALVRDALDWALAFGSKSGKAEEDGKRLKEILGMDPEELCRLQNRS